MAFTVTVDESKTIISGSDGGFIKLYGTAVSDGGSTGGVVNVKAYGLRNIYGWSFTCSSGEEAAQAVKTYSAGEDSDIITITTQANATYDFMVEGKSCGIPVT